MLARTEEYFITIVKEGSLQKAAQALYVTQPSLTKYIQRLERQLGSKLFDRTMSPMRLTDAGVLYYRHLMEAREREQALLTQLEELRRTERGTLKLGIPSYCGQCYLPLVLPKFQQRYPQVRIELYEDHGQAIQRALAEGIIDLGILHQPIENEALCCRELLTEQILLAAPRQGSANRMRGSLEDFRSSTFLMPHPEQKLGRMVASALSGASFSPQVYLRTENVMTMLSLVALGMGVGFIPGGGIRSLPENILERVTFYELEELEAVRWKLLALQRSGCHTPAYTEFFITLFQKIG